MRVNCRPSGSQLGAPFSKEHEGGDRLRLQTRANYQKLPGQKVFPTMDDRRSRFALLFTSSPNNELGIADIKRNPITRARIKTRGRCFEEDR